MSAFAETDEQGWVGVDGSSHIKVRKTRFILRTLKKRIFTLINGRMNNGCG